ncbi:putative F-box domain-containing protein [Rosa chinensis]|uniref:Putative F-box domain-containing protein n=1 Tax=Rosa chinensis TaxID=74649 RepID=A0A2P6QLN3_ROSCH|nr:F-box/kelch-repeat protein At3g06240 [Rosa chinensis]PRQ35078.1 putative F-box domain-containing protein [Rosa chinensis]
MSSCFDLPEDIVVKILCRLPVKSLIRFTCVSKRWCSITSMIISDPKFGKSHFQLASQQRALRRKVLLTSYPTVREPGPRPNACYDPNSKLPPRFQSLEDKYLVKNFTFPSKKNAYTEEMGSCNGLVLVGNPCFGGYENLSIWNLSTGFFRKIPSPSVREKLIKSATDQAYRYFINFGFGHELASDDYKLVFILCALGQLVEVHIFSMRANIWKAITAPHLSRADWDSGQGTFSNGAIHRVVHCRSESSDPVIYAFDLAEEEFRQVPLPPVLWQNEEDRNPTEITTLVHLGGYLCIWSRKRYNPDKGEVWAMTEYGVPESWVKLFNFRVPDLPDVFASLYSTWDLCFITESGTMVISLSKELFWIECHNDEKPICSGRYRLEEVHPEVPGCVFHFHATAYDETLLSVAE